MAGHNTWLQRENENIFPRNLQNQPQATAVPQTRILGLGIHGESFIHCIHPTETTEKLLYTRHCAWNWGQKNI